jgi:hypothetical protein
MARRFFGGDSYQMKKTFLILIPIFGMLLMVNTATSATYYIYPDGGTEDQSNGAVDAPSLVSGQEGLNPNPPNYPARLIFIHHSTGENWLSDENGGLGIALRDNNYYVSDTNYGWGPNQIGDYTPELQRYFIH